MTETAALTPAPHPAVDPYLPARTLAAPRLVEEAGAAAIFAWDEFFRGSIRNPHTRTAYSRAVRALLTWLEDRRIPLAVVTPGILGGYFDELGGSVPTKKLALAAIRRFYDTLALRHVVAFNPALNVRGERYSVVEGKTPEIPIGQARALLASIDVRTRAGLRDRAVLACLVYTAARAGAVAGLRMKDLIHDGTQYSLRFTEKGGKERTLPVRHDLERYLLEYLATAVGEDEPKAAPLFRSLGRRTDAFTGNPMNGTDIWRMMKRRLKDAGLSDIFSPHSFRATTCTDLLEQGTPLEDVQHLAGHADPRTTRLYDRRSRRVTRNLVERISV